MLDWTLTASLLLWGLIAFLLTLYWITRVERDSGRLRPRWSEIFTRFPKFVIGFIPASLVMAVLINLHLLQSSPAMINDLNALRTLALYPGRREHRSGLPARELQIGSSPSTVSQLAEQGQRACGQSSPYVRCPLLAPRDPGSVSNDGRG
ncbi:hypothetical protein [Thermogemmatispora tikiterensis]|uniref:Uncharacterized protein n=1 Tax=Thermogemmatispora tikiterensis TaxID=1825093 RepID=A0A328VCS7_9CHLR|nr:hypothetical protein [Thermogemmatispora tikiterensis]RAQ95548.1 hypothetical protein A4R35_08370 [Thermogemmatispora tikiterensis]